MVKQSPQGPQSTNRLMTCNAPRVVPSTKNCMFFTTILVPQNDAMSRKKDCSKTMDG